MCIIVAKPKDKVISKDILRRCFEGNTQGCGFAVACGDHVDIFKGYFKFKTFWKAYAPYNKGFAALIHFRIATHGVVDGSNTQPFHVTENLAFAHNGMLSGFDDPQKSDSARFNECILKNLPDDFHTNAATLWLVGEAIGMSKMTFLDSKGNFYYANKILGVEEDGIWYSNTGFRVSTATRDYDDWVNARRAQYHSQNVYPYSVDNSSWDPKDGKAEPVYFCETCGERLNQTERMEGYGICKSCFDWEVAMQVESRQEKALVDSTSEAMVLTSDIPLYDEGDKE